MCTSVYQDNYIRHDACLSNGIVTTHGFIFRIRDVNQVIHIPTVDDPEIFFIFGSNRGLQLLGQSQHWYADGTFKVCPQVFFQVCTIHAQINGQVLPCVFSLLPNKVEGTYDRLFQDN